MKKIFTLLAAGLAFALSSQAATTIEVTGANKNSTGSNSSYCWMSFKNSAKDYKYSNNGSKSCGTANGKDGVAYIKASSGVQYTLEIPEGKVITAITIKGGSRNASTSTYLKELNGVTYSSTDYVFVAGLDKTAGTTATEYTFTFDTPVSTALTFTHQGTESLFNFYLTEEDGVVLTALTAPEITANAATGLVTIAQAENAEVRYTTDGSAPGASSELYTEPFTVADGTMVKAIAIGDLETTRNSEVASVYVLLEGVEVAQPEIRQINGTFYVACPTVAAEIKYQLGDGEWIDYAHPVTLDETATVNVKATRGESEKTASAEVTVTPAPEVDKIIALGYGSFTDTDKTYLKGEAGNESRAFGMNLRIDNEGKDKKEYGNNGSKIWMNEVKATRTGIKGSNGRKNTLEIPEHWAVSRIVLYSNTKTTNTATIAGWQEVNGVTYDINEVPFGCFDGMDFGTAGVADRRIFDFEEPARGEITFTNGGNQVEFMIAVYMSQDKTTNPWIHGHSDEKTYEVGEEIILLHSDADEAIYYTLDGKDPVKANVQTEAPEAAPAKAVAVTDEDHTDKTYVYDRVNNPIIYDGSPLNIRYMSHADGMAPSEVMSLKVNGDGQTTGIASVAADNEAPAEYYNLQGIRVENPSNGIFILRQGNNVTKIKK